MNREQKRHTARVSQDGTARMFGPVRIVFLGLCLALVCPTAALPAGAGPDGRGGNSMGTLDDSAQIFGRDAETGDRTITTPERPDADSYDQRYNNMQFPVIVEPQLDWRSGGRWRPSPPGPYPHPRGRPGSDAGSAVGLLLAATEFRAPPLPEPLPEIFPIPEPDAMSSPNRPPSIADPDGRVPQALERSPWEPTNPDARPGHGPVYDTRPGARPGPGPVYDTSPGARPGPPGLGRF